jgi:hypothetical protein
MGEVYRAWDDRLNRAVAIKLLSQAGAADTQSVDRFVREARAASALNHPNIVTIHDAGQAEAAGHFIVQELVQGRRSEASRADHDAHGRDRSGAPVAKALAAATRLASCIATSSPKTSWCGRMAT